MICWSLRRPVIDSVVRAGDLVARLGGDEFVVVMRDLDDPTEAVRAAERLVAAFRMPFTTRWYRVLSLRPASGWRSRPTSSTADDLVREADTAMYRGQGAGPRPGGGVQRGPSYGRHRPPGGRGRPAPRPGTRRIGLWYQPEIDLGTGAVIAVEALLRWHHPDGETWTADRFIDVAEDTGLILDIGDWVLREACRQAASWDCDRPGRPITMRVNVSALQFAEAGLLDAIDEALTSSGAGPGTVVPGDNRDRSAAQTTLPSETTSPASTTADSGSLIDDFGTGYASLGYLSSFAVDVIKIDRSFVTGATASDHSQRLVAGIIALAKVLGIAVTAEGVEQPEQAAHLYQLGCPSAQGWLYAPALPPDQVSSLLDHVYPHPGEPHVGDRPDLKDGGRGTPTRAPLPAPQLGI